MNLRTNKADIERQLKRANERIAVLETTDYQMLEARAQEQSSALETVRKYLEALGKDYMLKLAVTDPRRRAWELALNEIDDALMVQS